MVQGISNVVLYLSNRSIANPGNSSNPGTLYKLKFVPPPDTYFDIDHLLMDLVVCSSTCVPDPFKSFKNIVGLSIHAGGTYPSKEGSTNPGGTHSGEGVFFFLGTGGSKIQAIGPQGSGVANWTLDDYRPLDGALETHGLQGSFVADALTLGFTAERLGDAAPTVLSIFNGITGVWSDTSGVCSVSSTAATPALCVEFCVVAHRLHMGASSQVCRALCSVMCEHFRIFQKPNLFKFICVPRALQKRIMCEQLQFFQQKLN